jgi:transmembrane sensor
MGMERKKQIKSLIEKFYHNTISDAEMGYLLTYLKAEDSRNELLEIYQDSWSDTSNLNASIDSERILTNILNKTELSKMPDAPRTRPKGNYWLVFRAAALFIFAFGLSWLVHSIIFRESVSNIADLQQRIEVPYGSKSRVLLPDGSTVTLNSGSSLEYSTSGFNTESRSVSITGEGFFDVTKDKSRPFYVITPGLKLKVIGTTFNIKAYPDEKIEEATLVTGAVEISINSDKNESDKKITLKPNQSAVFVKSERSVIMKEPENQERVSQEALELKSVNVQTSSKTEQVISWKEDRLVFDNEPFSNLLIKLERWYDVKIILNDPELATIRFSGTFDKETLEQVMDALIVVTPFNYGIKQNIITITPKN